MAFHAPAVHHSVFDPRAHTTASSSFIQSRRENCDPTRKFETGMWTVCDDACLTTGRRPRSLSLLSGSGGDAPILVIHLSGTAIAVFRGCNADFLNYKCRFIASHFPLSRFNCLSIQNLTTPRDRNMAEGKGLLVQAK
jgi:hypothetical protein